MQSRFIKRFTNYLMWQTSNILLDWKCKWKVTLSFNRMKTITLKWNAQMSQSPSISVTCFPRVEGWHRCMKNCMHHLLMKSFRYCYKCMHKGQTSEDSHGKQGICHTHIDVNDVVAASVSDNHRRFVRGAVFWLWWICLQSCPV